MSKSTFFLTHFDVNATGGLVVYIVIVIAIYLHWHMMATMIEDVTDFSEHNGTKGTQYHLSEFRR